MRTSEIITVDPGATGSISRKTDFQSGTVIGTVIPIDSTEEIQEEKKFRANFKWSVNNKFWMTEPICDTGTNSSSGEALVTTAQGPFMRVEVTNMETAPQKFFVSVNIPGTSSLGA